MSGLTLAQNIDLLAKLNKLMKISGKREKASADHLAANQRWNAARQEYAALHRLVVLEYGTENAPVWLESIYGKRD